MRCLSILIAMQKIRIAESELESEVLRRRQKFFVAVLHIAYHFCIMLLPLLVSQSRNL